MPQIPQGTVDIIRESSDILEVISQYVDLKQRGSNYFGICPFHDEKTPSFSVAPSKQIYHCFGCNSGGNVFSFIMEYQKISFPEAVKFVADRYNIKIEYKRNDFQSETYTGLYELHNIAMKLYQDNLFSEEGSGALEYLYKRGLSEDIIKQFKIGFESALIIFFPPTLSIQSSGSSPFGGLITIGSSSPFNKVHPAFIAAFAPASSPS